MRAREGETWRARDRKREKERERDIERETERYRDRAFLCTEPIRVKQYLSCCGVWRRSEEHTSELQSR